MNKANVADASTSLDYPSENIDTRMVAICGAPESELESRRDRLLWKVRNKATD